MPGRSRRSYPSRLCAWPHVHAGCRAHRLACEAITPVLPAGHKLVEVVGTSSDAPSAPRRPRPHGRQPAARRRGWRPATSGSGRRRVHNFRPGHDAGGRAIEDRELRSAGSARRRVLVRAVKAASAASAARVDSCTCLLEAAPPIRAAGQGGHAPIIHDGRNILQPSSGVPQVRDWRVTYVGWTDATA